MRHPSPVPERPSPLEEALAHRWFFAFSPRIGRVRQPLPPSSLAPWEPVRIERRRGRGALAGTWYRAAGEPRGVVLLVPPWSDWGRAYFHRRGRIEAVRRAGYAALTLDLPGFGGSGPLAGFPDLEIEDALEWLARRLPRRPLHLWGVSAGGYWAHPAVARSRRVDGAFFEDVAGHLLDWSYATRPAGRPLYGAFRRLFRGADRFLEAGRHAAVLGVGRAAYVGGGADPGIPAAVTRELARRAGADCRIVDRAGHLQAIKLERRRVHRLALSTFAAAEGRAWRPAVRVSAAPRERSVPAAI